MFALNVVASKVLHSHSCSITVTCQ